MSQVFTRSKQLADQIHDIRLKIPEWKILFTIDGVMNSEAIAGFLDISEQEVLQTLEKLKEMQLVAKMDEHEEGEAREEAMTFGEELSGTSEIESLEEDTEQEEVEQEDESPEEFEGGRIELSSEETEDKDEFLTEEEPLSLEEDESIEESTEPEEEEAPEAPPEPIEQEEEAGGFTEEPAESKEKEEEPLSDQEFDQFIGGLLNEEEKESTGLETEEPSLESEMPTEVEKEKEEADLEFGDFFKGETLESETEVEEEEKPGQPDLEEVTEEKAEPELPSAEELPGKGDKTILVVDDSVVIRKMVEIALENEKYNIMSVATGKEALKYLDENTPDLIILDIMLPDVNGLDVLKAVKASKQIPVVMLSAKDTPRETSKAKELGANDFIPKPFKDEELVNKVKELVSE